MPVMIRPAEKVDLSLEELISVNKDVGTDHFETVKTEEIDNTGSELAEPAAMQIETRTEAEFEADWSDVKAETSADAGPEA